MTATNPMKALSAFIFFGLISGFVMCKSGVLDKKTTTSNPSVVIPTKDTAKPLPRHFGGSKSGMIIPPKPTPSADTTTQNLNNQLNIDEINRMNSSKSGPIINFNITPPADSPNSSQKNNPPK